MSDPLTDPNSYLAYKLANSRPPNAKRPNTGGSGRPPKLAILIFALLILAFIVVAIIMATA
jgi:hypothetical protein